MITHPLDQDLPALKTLWQEAFHDSQRDTEKYFSLRHRHENMLVLKNGNRIDGMLSMLPLNLQSGEKVYQARYVFAVATRQEARGQGISTHILQEAHQWMDNQGVWASVLVPANDALFSFYEKRGYHNAFLIKESTFLRKQIPDQTGGSFFDCPVEEYLKIRNTAFQESKLFAKWDQEALEFIKQSLQGAGGLLRLEAPSGQTAVVACEYQGDEVRVIDVALDHMPWQTALGIIAKAFPAKHYVLRLSDDQKGAGQSRPFGMIRWLRPAPKLLGETAPYLSFAKD